MNIDFDALSPQLADNVAGTASPSSRWSDPWRGGDDRPDIDVDFVYRNDPGNVLGLEFFGLQE